MTTRKPHRHTRQRQVVLEELKKLTSHPTAADLYEITRTRLPRISLGTVYRNLELLAETGVIQKLDVGGSEARFDGNPERHYHVRCIHCDRVDDVHHVPDEVIPGEVERLAGYEIVGYRLDFIGVCPQCQGRPNAQGSGMSPEERN